MDQSTEALAMMVNELSKRVGKLERLDRPALAIASGAMLTKSGVQTVNNTTDTAITFDGEVFDTDNFHNNSTNTSRLTAPVTGYYLVGGTVNYGTLSDQKYFQVSIRKGGAHANGDGKAYFQQSAATNGQIGVPFARLVQLNAGEYVELMLMHNQGSSINVVTSTNGTTFWIFKVG